MLASDQPRYLARLGLWSAILATIAAIAFGASVVLLLVSSPASTWEGIEAYVASYDPLPVYLTNLSSLAIAPTFVVMVGALLGTSDDRHRPLAQIALTFSGAYLVVVALNYILQTTVIRAAIEAGAGGGLGLAVMGNPASTFWMGEMVGYSFMVLAGLFLVPLFGQGRSGATIRWIFVLNGLTTAVAAITYFLTVDAMHPLVAASLGVWGLSWPVATGLIAYQFSRLTGLERHSLVASARAS